MYVSGGPAIGLCWRFCWLDRKEFGSFTLQRMLESWNAEAEENWGGKTHAFILPADHYAIYLSTSLVRAYGTRMSVNLSLSLSEDPSRLIHRQLSHDVFPRRRCADLSQKD